MKNQSIRNLFLFALGLMVLLIYSCNSDVEKSNDESLREEVSYDQLIGKQVGVKEAGKISLNVTDAAMLEAFKFYALECKMNIVPERFEILNLDDKDYLRFYNTDKTVSTVALLGDATGRVELGKTLCTSVQCASGGGCIPDGNYCTKCVPAGVNPSSGITGDCTRTTSN